MSREDEYREHCYETRRSYYERIQEAEADGDELAADLLRAERREQLRQLDRQYREGLPLGDSTDERR